MHASLTDLRRRTGELLEHVRNGEEVLITEDGRPLFRMVPIGVTARYDELLASGRVIPATAHDEVDMDAVRAYLRKERSTPQ